MYAGGEYPFLCGWFNFHLYVIYAPSVWMAEKIEKRAYGCLQHVNKWIVAPVTHNKLVIKGTGRSIFRILLT